MKVKEQIENLTKSLALKLFTVLMDGGSHYIIIKVKQSKIMYAEIIKKNDIEIFYEYDKKPNVVDNELDYSAGLTQTMLDEWFVEATRDIINNNFELVCSFLLFYKIKQILMKNNEVSMKKYSYRLPTGKEIKIKEDPSLINDEGLLFQVYPNDTCSIIGKIYKR